MTARDLTMEQILIYLREQEVISDLGKDILSTYDTLCCNPFNRNDAASRIILNNAKHPEIPAALALRPDTVSVDLSRTSEVGTWNCLYLQFREMCREEAVTLGVMLEENASGGSADGLTDVFDRYFVSMKGIRTRFFPAKIE